MRMIADLELATRVGMTTDEWIVRLCHKLRPGVGTSEAAPIASAFRPHHSSLWYWNFSGARAGVDGIIGSRSHPRDTKAGWLQQQHNKPSFFLNFFFFSLFTAAGLICIHPHAVSLRTQTPKVFAAELRRDYISNRREGMKETTTKIKEIKTKYIKIKRKTCADPERSRTAAGLVHYFPNRKS